MTGLSSRAKIVWCNLTPCSGVLRRTRGEMPGAWRVSWGAGLRRWRGHDQPTLLLEKGENVVMHVGIVLAHNHMPVALFPEQLLVR